MEETKPQPQHPLAFDADGNPLHLPEGVKRWRVRRGGGKRGRPRNVFDADTGLQLEIPVGATLDDLIDRGCVADRYRLEAIDESGHVVPGVVAVVEVPAIEEEAEPEVAPKKDEETVAHLRSIIDRLVTSNSNTMQAMASAFGTVRPQHETPAPIVLQQSAPPAMQAPDAGMKPEQIMQMLTTFGPMVGQAIKGFMAGNMAAPSAGSA